MSKSSNEKEVERYFKKTKKKLITVLGGSTTNGAELNNVCNQLFGNKYSGTFSVDNVSLKNNKMCIVNTDKSGKPGKHWVAIYKTKNYVYIYDSYARKSSKILKHLIDKLKKYNIKWQESDRGDYEQKGFNDKTCGQNCISWLSCVHKYGIKQAVLI